MRPQPSTRNMVRACKWRSRLRRQPWRVHLKQRRSSAGSVAKNACCLPTPAQEWALQLWAALPLGRCRGLLRGACTVQGRSISRLRQQMADAEVEARSRQRQRAAQCTPKAATL